MRCRFCLEIFDIKAFQVARNVGEMNLPFTETDQEINFQNLRNGFPNGGVKIRRNDTSPERCTLANIEKT